MGKKTPKKQKKSSSEIMNNSPQQNEDEESQAQPNMQTERRPGAAANAQNLVPPSIIATSPGSINQATNPTSIVLSPTVMVLRNGRKTQPQIQGNLTQGTNQFISTSTPALLPNTFRQRRSPESETDNEDRHSAVGLCDTPLGSGVNHHLTQTEPEVDILPPQPSLPHIENCLQNMNVKIQLFADQFTSRVGWTGELESYVAKLKAELTQISDRCKDMQYLDSLEKVYNLFSVLEEHLGKLRKYARAQQENQRSPYPFRHSPLNRQGGELDRRSPQPQNIGEKHKDNLPSRGGTPDLIDRDTTADPNETVKSRGIIPNQVLKQLQLRVKTLENTLPVESMLSRLGNLEDGKCSKHEFSELALRVCNLEMATKQILDQHLDEKVAEQDMKIAANLAASRKYEVLAKGFCGDNTKLRKDLSVYSVKISNLEKELGDLKKLVNSGLQWDHNRGSLNQEEVNTGTRPRVPQPGTTRPTNSGYVGYNATRPASSGYVVNNATNTGIPGISQLPTPAVTTLSYTAYGGVVTTAPVMSNQVLSNTNCNTTNPTQFIGGYPNIQYEAPQQTQGGNGRASSPQGSSPCGSSEVGLTRRGIRLKRAGKNLRMMLTPAVDANLTKVIVQGIHASLLPAVDSERRELNTLLEKYENERPGPPDRDLLDEIEDVIEDARTWSRGMRDKHRELDCSKKSLDKKLYEGMKRFGENSEINVFEFLKKFESLTEEQGTAAERATLLYENYLSKEIQMDLIERKDCYQLMRMWLINQFGDVKVITDNILRTLSKEIIPSDSVPSQNSTSYYRKLNSVIKRVLELSRTVDMPIEELEAHIYGSDFMAKLTTYLPEKAKFDYIDKLMSAGLDHRRIRGEPSFAILSATVQRHFCLNESSSSIEAAYGHTRTKNLKPDRQTPPKRKRGSYAVQVEEDEEDVPVAVHYQDGPKKSQSQGKNKTNKSPGKKSTNFKFPCVIKDHSHEIGECAEFFTITSYVRRSYCFKSRNCLTCLGKFENCKSGCTVKLPPELICPECKTWSDQNNLPVKNILVCTFKNHTKPDNQTLVDALDKYFKHFDPNKVKVTVKLAAHMHLVAHSAGKKCSQCGNKKCSCKPQMLTSNVDPAVKIPAINTHSGETVNLTNVQVKTESEHDSFYVMQILNLKGRDVLTFYDRGANQHLINGQLAEDLKLKVESNNPVSIGVVGGGNFWTRYGRYAVALGPTEDNYWHQFTAQGMDPITAKFPQYNLSEVNKEVRGSGCLKGKAKVLPKYIGGMEAGLLIGINDTGLEPVRVFQLPCGLGVFKSPLKDKFNSRYCYGGPHKVFSEVNKKIGNNSNHVNIYFMQMINQYRNSPYTMLLSGIEPELIENKGLLGVSYMKDTTLKSRIALEDGADVYPSPVNEVDLRELGILEPSKEVDEEVCTCSPAHDVSEHGLVQSVNLGIYKAKVPVSQRKEYFDEDDQENVQNYRCDDCARCKKCFISDRSKMMSLQEKIEQEAIEKSVHIDLNQNKVFVDLPFIKPPVDALMKRHMGEDNNFKQALKIYQTQCRKPEVIKSAMREVHKDLVQKGFMKKLTDLSTEQQQTINTAGFRHYMPWRSVEKQDSISTPYRMVVDASITGLNDILAKGENNMAKINHILIRNRCRKEIWSTDISKMYNQLHLNDSALPYGLFLFSEELDPKLVPEVYCMVVAWYGVTPTGNQGGEALERLAKQLEEEYPLAGGIIKNDRYVDDVLSGDNTKDAVENQILETKAALQKGGFQLKYVVKSGENPCSEASSDGKSLKVLGYKWTTKEDKLYPGFSELNFNKRRRGSKKPNPFPVTSPSDVTKLLSSTNVTRRMVVSKIAEIWDPVGIWEPYKLQLKLDNIALKGLEWDVALDKDQQQLWKRRFQEFLEIPLMDADRCVIPEDAVDPDSVRLICISDAAEKAGGCVIYAGYEKPDGTFSCKVLTARSKLMNHKVPRNELEGILLMVETANTVKKALGDKVKEIHYFTDSTIAMCWCHNTSKKLRMFTLYRVADIRRYIKLTTDLTDDEPLPLYHIDGKLNIADMLTKNHEISPKDIGASSQWQNGLPWMRLPFDQMPITTYQNLTISKSEEVEIDTECFPELIMSKEQKSAHSLQIGMENSIHCIGCKPSIPLIPQEVCYGTQDKFDHCDLCKCGVKFSCFSLKVGKGSQALVNVIKVGWLKSLRILTIVLKFIAYRIHSVHQAKGIEFKDTCEECKAQKETNGVKEETDKIYMKRAKDYLFRTETKRIKSILPKKKLEKFTEQDGILYSEGRLTEESPFKQSDLGFEVFFDNTEIKSMLPVVLADSDIFFAHVVYIHEKVRVHSGVEITLREVFKTMMVLNNPRRIIQRIRRDCTRCRLIAKRTLELKMASHPSARTHITPPFYYCQVDTVFGFKGQPYKNARKTMKIYALVIVCVLTGATNILAVEGLETQDIIQAIERHASRHGVPAVLYIDNGTQLIALENTVFNLRDMQTQVYDSLGLKVVVSNAKSHEERGRVEAKVKILRQMLNKLSVKAETAMTAMQWETLFSKISNMIDDLPIAKCSNTNADDPGWNIITANRLKLGRNNNRSLEGWIDIKKGAGAEALLRRNQELQKVWYQMFIDRIHHLIPRPNKWLKSDNINIGDICLFTYTENAAMGKDVWKLGRVESIPQKNKVVITFPGNTEIKGQPKMKTIVRCPRNISIISAVGEINLNSEEYFNRIKEIK